MIGIPGKIDIKEDLQKRMQNKLEHIYGTEKGKKVFARLMKILLKFNAEYGGVKWEGTSLLDEQDMVLITYGDQVKEEGRKPLATLKSFLDRYFGDTISTVHILPFFPYSSDDGFAVIDYKRVNPDFGSWTDIEGLGENFQLMFDAVINHISSQSEWFKQYKAGDAKYKDYFIEVDPDADLSGITRPRAKPLLTPVETAGGLKHVWTTFSPDQIDLNFANEDVLLDVIEILLFYIKKGAKIIRLDAIAYLWKKLGTTCIHLEETHKVVQLFRDIFEAVAPYVLILTETNVPHEENISYFGDGQNEAHMVYQFALPPLVLYTFASGNGRKLSEWASSLKPTSEENTFFNFLASHDGIGVRPVEGILTDEEIMGLVERAKEHGGYVSYKTNSDGSKSPYELNITYFDAIVDDDESQDIQVDKFIASQAIMLAMQGVPGIYIHSLLGSRNYNEGVEETGQKRTINREKLERKSLEEELNDPSTIRSQVYRRFRELLKIRREHKAFHPNGKQRVLFLDDRVFSLLRISPDNEEKIIALYNVTPEKVETRINLMREGIEGCKYLEGLISGEKIDTGKDAKISLVLRPYQVRWLRVE